MVGSDLEGQSGRYLGQEDSSNKVCIVDLLSGRRTSFLRGMLSKTCILIVVFPFATVVTETS